MALDRLHTLLETSKQDVGFILFTSLLLDQQPMQSTIRRLAQHYCLNHANISSTSSFCELIDTSLGLYVARALDIQQVQDEYSLAGLTKPFLMDQVTKQVDQALSSIGWPKVLRFTKFTNESLCNALVWLHVFQCIGIITSLEPHRPRIETTLQIRRFRYRHLTNTQDWQWQSHLVTHIIFTHSDWSRGMLGAFIYYESEFNYILDNLSRAITEENVKLVGEFLHCLTILHYVLTSTQRARVKLAKEFLASVTDLDDDAHRSWCILAGSACSLD